MKDSMLVSVIIPVYNVAPYLREAIDSVINQTYKNIEIIIIDDGSTDESGSICDEYCNDSRVQVIHQENKGLSAARNKGLDLMKGDLVAFLDSDDSLYPNMIEHMIQHMEQSKADIVICEFKWDDRIGHLESKICNRKEALRDLIFDKMERAPWNKIYKKYIWDGVCFPEGYNYEGTRTTYKLIERANIIEVISECLIYHRTRPGSIVQTPSIKNIEDFFLATEDYEGFAKNSIPDILSEEEYLKFLESRFRQKVKNWSLLNRKDRVLSQKHRSETIDQISEYRLDGWRKKSRVKYFLFRYVPWILDLIWRVKSE